MDTGATTQNDAAEQDPPDFLQSYEGLAQHFRAHFNGLTTVEKGRRFAHFAQRLIPQIDVGRNFETPELSERESHDDGVDLTARGRDGRTLLHVQSRLWIDRADALDNILSKFLAFSSAAASTASKQRDLFPTPDDVPRQFLIVTLSPLANIRRKYEEKEFGSRQFFDELMRTRRLEFCDGNDILGTLKAAYDKLAQLPSRIVLNLETDAIAKGSVYLGIITGRELRALYTKLGDSLFFENIRDFVGIPIHLRDRAGRSSPNAEILKTIENAPERMLERNNGIVSAPMMSVGDSRGESLC